MKGWIKLHRQLRSNPLMRRPAYRAVWIELLLEAEHGMKKVKGKWIEKTESELKSIMWKGNRIRLQPGQLTCGEKQLSEWTGVPRGTVRRVLECFENEQQIERQTSNHFSLITVKKWHEYQIYEQQIEQPVNNQRTTSEQPVNTPRECKNVDNVDNVERESTPAQIARSFFANQTDQNKAIQLLIEKGIQEQIAKAEIDKFVMYWTEPNRSGTKTRWEMQKTFEISRRLVTWINRITAKKTKPITYIS